jgi:hypothetical protein
MANNKNIKPHEFTSDHQPPGASKSRKGSPNRTTIFEKWGNAKITFKNIDEETGKKILENLKEELKITLLDAQVLSAYKIGQSGDLKAIQFIFDCLYGKITEKQEISAVDEVQPSYDLEKLSTEQLLELQRLLELAS